MLAILYKLQVDLHDDADDDGLSAMLCAGRFNGGILQVPQLGLNLRLSCFVSLYCLSSKSCFRYRPGDVVLILAAKLFHKVTKWEAVPRKADDTTNPGRMSFVFFSHKDVVDFLETKDEKW